MSAEEIEKDLINYSNWTLIKDLGKFLKPYRWRFLLVSLLRLISDISNLYIAYGFALIVTFFSKYSAGQSLQYFWKIIFFMFISYQINHTLRFLAKYIGYRIAEKVALDSQLKIVQHLALLDVAWHEKENAGNKMKRIQKGADGLSRILQMWINSFIQIGVNFIGMIFVMSNIDKIVGGVMVVYLITYFAISFSMLRKARIVSQKVDAKEEEVSGLIFQIINNIRSVKVLGMMEKILTMISVQITGLFETIQRRVFSFQTRSLTLNFWTVSFRLGMFAIVCYGIANGHYAVGLLVLFNGYFNALATSVEELSETSQDFIVCKYGIARMQRTLDEPILIDDETGKVDLPKDWKKIIIDNLSFAYGEKQILKNVSFEIKRGERVGVVGLSGAGKSTLMKLLLKENESYTGEILFDDVPLRKIKKNSYFKQVGVVLQDTEVFNFTLRENITIASLKKRSQQDLQQALDIAHVSDFVSKLPLGLETFIGEKGIKLSGGERQRLGIARAVFKQPEILFLDEATSHLDLESEEKIKDSLHKFLKKVTAVVIAHRLTTIREMDKILVIEKGRIVEAGSFEELYASEGRLYELWEKQKF